MKLYSYPPFPSSPPPSGIFTTVPLHRTTQRLIIPHPFQDILNGHTVFLNIKKSTLHVLKVLPMYCIFVLIRDCIGPCVCGPSRGAKLLRIIEGYGPPVVPDWVFAKIAAIVMILEEPDRFSPDNDDENGEVLSKIINKIDHAINWLVKGLHQGLSFSTFELNSNMWNKLLLGHQVCVRTEFFNDIVRSFPPLLSKFRNDCPIFPRRKVLSENQQSYSRYIKLMMGWVQYIDGLLYDRIVGVILRFGGFWCNALVCICGSHCVKLSVKLRGFVYMVSCTVSLVVEFYVYKMDVNF